MIYRTSFQKKKVYLHLAATISDRRLSAHEVEQVWEVLPRAFLRQKFIEVHACVLMSNHLHALFSVCESYFELAESALLAECQTLYHGYLYDHRKHFKLIRIQSFAAYREIYRYIYRNPVEARLVHLAENYPYSTLAQIMGFSKNTFFANDNMGLITNPFQILKWINQSEEKVIFH
jgi:hypothetical protein